MRYPLNDPLYVTQQFLAQAPAGTGLKDTGGVSRHIGVDWRAQSPQPVYAPGSGVVTQSFRAASGNQIIEIRIAGKLWRFLHLSQRLVFAGATVSQGTKIGMSGNSGGVAYHLHVDCRKDGTTWNASLYNYYDPRKVIEAANAVAAPSTGKRLYFAPIGQTATFYPVKGGTYAMKIKDASYNWSVLKAESNRVLVNSASAGGDCWVYLKYSNTGNTIPGRYIK